MDIIETIQKQVNKIARNKYQEEEKWCTPIFIVSLLEHDKIILTCKHRQLAFSKVIFPADKSDVETWGYGLDVLEEHMKGLYNRTM